MSLASWLVRVADWVRTSLIDTSIRRRWTIVLVAVLVVCYAAAVITYVVTVPEVGLRCAFTPVVNHFYPEFLEPSQQPHRPQSGDLVVALGGEEVDTWTQLLRLVISAGERPADGVALLEEDGVRRVRVEFERPETGERFGVWCRLGPTPIDALLPSILWFVLKLGLFAVAAVVYWQRPDERSAGAFFWLCVVSFGAFLGGYHWTRIVTQPVLLLVFMCCSVLLPAVTLHFYLMFPRPKDFIERRPGWLLAVYGPAVLFLAALLWAYVRVRVSGDGAGSLLIEMLYAIYAYLGVAGLWYLGSVAALFHSYLVAHNPAERNQVKWLLVGAALATLPMGYSLYLAIYDPPRFGAGAAAWPMFAASVFITLAYAVSITRYGLMRIDQLLSSGAAYFLVSTLAAALYYTVVFAGFLIVGRRFVEGPSLVNILAVSATAMLLMALVDAGRGRLMRALDKLYRREKHQLDQTLVKMSQAVERLVDPPTLARRMLHTAAEMLSAPGGAVYLRQGEPGLLRLTESLGPPPTLTDLLPGSPLVEALTTSGNLTQDGPMSAARKQLTNLGGAIAQGLLHEGQLVGLVILAPRPHEIYRDEDVGLLAAFAPMTALALVSAEGHQTIDTLNKELKAKVEKIAEQQRRILALQSQLTKRQTVTEELEPDPAPREGPVGSGVRMQGVLSMARRVAASSSAVLLRGESGTGKEVFARVLHEASPRANRSFVKVHCAALSSGLLESELFGHVKGAFTSAIRDKVGRFEAADGGTLFLDEIGDISLDVQTKLLRVLEEMTFERVGSSEPVKVDVRLIAATHRDLEGMIADGRFREDLFFRLNVISIALPPLRERREDIPELVAHFLEVYGDKTGKKGLSMEDDALAVLKGHVWRGNIRELENVIERAVVIAEGPIIGVAELPEEVRNTSDADLGTLAAAVNGNRAERDRRERESLLRALSAAGGNKAEAARALGWARSTLVSRLKKYGLT